MLKTRSRFTKLKSKLTGLKFGEALPYLFFFLLALGLRLWGLGERPIHYDESLHAFYSWRFYTGEGYEHSPMMHGPFKFISTALVFLLAGDSDFTARLLPAIWGSLAVGVIYFLRQELGKIGGILTALFVAFSPSLLYFSRFLRDDIFMVFWALLLLVCLVKYNAQPRARYLYLAAVVFSLSFATMENSYILGVIFMSFLFFRSIPELWQALKRRSLSSLSPGVSFLWLLFSLSLPLYSPGLSLFQGLLGVTLANRNPALGPEGAPIGLGLWVVVGLFAFFVAFSWFLGLAWQRRTWLISAGLFYGIYISLQTTFFTNPKGMGTGAWGAWGSVTYWLVQHAKERIQQPWFYYPYLLSIYEFLPLVLAIVAALYYWRRKEILPRFLIYWSVLSLAIYSYVGEKTPWLMVHITLPLLLLAGMGAGEWLNRGGGWTKGALTAFLLLSLAFSFKVSFQANYPGGQPKVEMLVYAQGGYELQEIRPQVLKYLEEGKGWSIDSSRGQPWQWYLRDYPNQVSYPDLATASPQGEGLILDPQHEDQVKPYLDRYGEKRTFKQLIWFPESYKGRKMVAIARDWPRYFLFRQVEDYWSWSTIIYFPRL